jgi:uncharacterized membrane protein
MNLTPEILSFLFGALLVLIGLVGGGFEIIQLKIPKVGLVVRICATIVGLFFLFLGFSNSEKTSISDEPAQSQDDQQ